MRTRLMISVLVISILYGMNIFLHQAAVPNYSSELALQQLQEDGSREELRAVEQVSNWIDMISVLVGMVSMAGIWHRPLRERLLSGRRRIKG